MAEPPPRTGNTEKAYGATTTPNASESIIFAPIEEKAIPAWSVYSSKPITAGILFERNLKAQYKKYRLFIIK